LYVDDVRRPFLVSNRLPVRVVAHDGAIDVVPSAGGVATALREVQIASSAQWLGWPGDVPLERREEVSTALAHLGALPVFLTEEESRGFYERFSTGVLWPLLHANLDKLPLDAEHDYRTYALVNKRFADHTLQSSTPDELIWIHDFQLALVPSEVRRRNPDAAIGFFLHVPFPPADVFRVLPWRRELLMGMLAADLVGLHTTGYAEHLRDAAATLLGARVDGDRVHFAGHSARLMTAPISVDVDRFERAAKDASVLARAAALKDEARGRKILLGVDRLDYTKGIPPRLIAVERLLDRWPELASQVHFVQVAVPTREHVDAYAGFRKEINELVGRINGKHGTAIGVPIHFMYREVPFDELVALYRAADVMVVTPYRDGMNLVCKEYVAARSDEQGVLILSELAGAADELDGALIVNPFDIEDIARRLKLAMTMPADEQRVRMAGMRRYLRGNDVKKWARDFLMNLEHDAQARGKLDKLSADLKRAVTATTLEIVLDYDGTVVGLEATPSQAAPDEELRALLAHLAACPGTTVHVVAGRDAETMTAWLGDLPLWLHAEHGAHTRPPHGPWAMGPPAAWLEEATHALDVVAAQAPGSFVEVKHSSVALHVRCVPKDARDTIAHGAALVLERLRARVDNLAVLVGDCLVEAHMADTDKGTIAESIAPGSLVLAAGDDSTDDELFGALRGDAVTIAVGPRPQRARHRMRDPVEVRALLSRLAGARCP
jgi:trehalose 6-phosphate synthase/phosphatase